MTNIDLRIDLPANLRGEKAAWHPSGISVEIPHNRAQTCTIVEANFRPWTTKMGILGKDLTEVRAESTDIYDIDMHQGWASRFD